MFEKGIKAIELIDEKGRLFSQLEMSRERLSKKSKVKFLSFCESGEFTIESVVVDDLNFFLSLYSTVQYCTTAKQPSNRDGLPPTTYNTHNTHLRIFVFDTYLIAS